MVDSSNNKKQSKYILNSSQKRVLITRIYPLLAIGSTLWMLGEIFFSFFIPNIDQIEEFYIIYIVALILEILLFITLYLISKKNIIIWAILLFFCFSFLAGILSLPIVIFTELLPQIHMFVTLTFIANLIVILISFGLKEKYFLKEYLWIHVILFIFGCLLGEVAYIIIFNIQNYLLSIPISLAYISIVVLISMFWGVKIVGKSYKDNWIYIAFKILCFLLIALVLAIIIVIIVLLIVILMIICGDGNLNLSGISWSGSSKSKKKKNVQ